ncbi:MAG: hypothetical protein HY737_08805 [Candidatus Omnitrophica bacterium]|nr:hypothetical protein [Candidatus Omnitrophota bacterium]
MRKIACMAAALVVLTWFSSDCSASEQPKRTPVVKTPHAIWKRNGDDVYNTNIGNIGIGTAQPTEKLNVVGNVKISGLNHGVIFPDGTIQATAATASVGVPSGFSIIGETTQSPPGYSFLGTIPVGTDFWFDAGSQLQVGRGYVSGATIRNLTYLLGGLQGSTILNLVTVVKKISQATVSYDDGIAQPMPTSRNNLTAEGVGGKIYAIGGSTTAVGSATDAVEAFDPVTNHWTTKAHLPTARFALASAVLDGKIYVIGGHNGVSGIDAVEIYDPLSDSWTSTTPLPTPRWSLAAASVNGKIYAISGTVVSGAQDGRVEEYNPATHVWLTKAPIPTPRRGLRAIVVNNRIFAIGGYSESGGVLGIVEEYNPSTDTWKSRPPMPTARQFPAVGLLGNSICVSAGSLGAGDSAVIELYEPLFEYFLHKKN